MGLTRRFVVAFVGVIFVVGACTSSKKSTSSTTQASRSTTSATGEEAGGPLVKSLPSGCDNATPTASQTVAFVRDGRAWAVDPTTGALACMFEASDPGLFEWGPQADRVVLGGLAVLGVGSNASRPTINAKPTWFSWSRPKGVAIVFTAGKRTALQRADINGTTNVADLTPLHDATYGDIAYHPSGLAIAFVAHRDDNDGIWISGNHGEKPQQLVNTNEGTQFGPLVFSHDGTQLFYGAHKRSGEYQVLAYILEQGTAGGLLWEGAGPIASIVETSAGVLVNAGPCAQRKIGNANGFVGGLDPPVQALGEVPDGTLVASGPCDAPRDILVVAPTGRARTIVEKAERVALRVAEVSPPPALPQSLPRSGFA